MKTILGMALALCFVAGAARAAMVERNLDYEVGGTKMRSVLVYDDAVKTPRPGLVMTPDWKGMNPDQVALGKQVAGKDYVILIADVYGVDVRPKTPAEAGAAANGMMEHRGELRARINAALAQLRGQVGKAPLDGRHWGAFGYCFGGTTTLDLARSGADMQGVVTFHAGLSTDDPALAKNIKAKVLVLNGGDDRNATDDVIAAFKKEMREGGVDWEFVSFGGAVHCFAIPTAHAPGTNCTYDPQAARRGYALMHAFFAEVFADRR